MGEWQDDAGKAGDAMAEELDVVRSGPQIATVLVDPAEAKAANDQINAVITEVLKEGKNGDYWQIPGTPTPTLLLPGAETLQRFFGLGKKVADPILGTVDVDGKPFFSAQVKVSITNPQDRVIAESVGWCDDTETKRAGGPGSKWKGNRHTIIQIATKRAYVSAIKSATGTSQHFTVDLEDQQQAAAGPVTAPEGMILLEDTPASKEDVEAFLKFFQERRGEESNVYVVEWLKEHQVKTQKGGAVSRWWLGARALALMKMVPAGPHSKESPDAQPELPVEPAEVVDAEVIDDDSIPFAWIDMFGRTFGGEHEQR